jgi:hypothetical protein
MTLQIMQVLTKDCVVQNGKMTMSLDGESALEESESSEALNASQPSYNLLSAIRRTLQQLPFSVEFEWVKAIKGKKEK